MTINTSQSAMLCNEYFNEALAGREQLTVLFFIADAVAPPRIPVLRLID